MSKDPLAALTLPPFDQWFMGIAHEIEMVNGILAEDISSNPAQLYQQLSKANAFHARMSELLAEATSHLLQAEYQMLLSAAPDLSVKEKEIGIKAKTANERRVRDILDGLTRSLNLRAFSLMNSRKQSIAEKSDF